MDNFFITNFFVYVIYVEITNPRILCPGVQSCYVDYSGIGCIIDAFADQLGADL